MNKADGVDPSNCELTKSSTRQTTQNQCVVGSWEFVRSYLKQFLWHVSGDKTISEIVWCQMNGQVTFKDDIACRQYFTPAWLK